jgi:Xaa-Pro aminopeptidase
MKDPKLSKIIRARILRARRALEAFPRTAALLVGSAPLAPRSRDVHHPYRQNSDFYYLTGSPAQDCLLLISPKETRPVLIGPAKDANRALWDGPGENLPEVARLIGAELVLDRTPQERAATMLHGHEVVFAPAPVESVAGDAVAKFRDQPAASRRKHPYGVVHSDLMLENLRLYKDAYEVRLIENAATKTNLSLFRSLGLIRAGTSERDYAQALEYLFQSHGGDIAFRTIAACGKNAATLHHMPGDRIFKDGELLLIDCGAESEMYAADITRTVPVSGRFSPIHRRLYQIVLDAQLAAIEAVAPGKPIGNAYNAAAKVLTRGLVALKALKGSTPALLKKRAFAPYFPHGIGHSLGLDVHDIGAIRGSNTAIMEPGMVITIEPGLYFPKGAGVLPPCGVRIEDDILVTARGRRVLSEGFPKDPDEVEKLFA